MANTDHKNILIMWLVLVADVFAYGVLVHLFVCFLPEYSSPAVTHHPDIAMMLGMLCLLLFSLALPPVIHRRRLKFKDVILRNLMVSTFTQGTFGLLWHVMTVNSDNEISYNVIITIGLFFSMVILRVLERTFLGHLRSKGKNTRAVVFIGSDPANKAIYDELISDPTTGYRVIGYYSKEEIEQAPESLKKLGDREDFRKLLTGEMPLDYPIDELYCSLSHAEDAEIRQIMQFCDREMIRFIYVPRIFQNLQLSQLLHIYL